MSLSISEIRTIYTSHAPKLYKFFYYKTLDRNITEDLTSETFLKFVTQAQKETVIENVNAYVYGIAKIVFLQFLREKYKEQEAIDYLNQYEKNDFNVYVDDVVRTVEDTPTLEEKALRYIQMLPEKQQQLVKLRLIDKLTPTEISHKIDKDLNYVKTTLKRGMKNLKIYAACTP